MKGWQKRTAISLIFFAKTNMKILLVNNHTRHFKNLESSLVGHEIEVVEYRPGVELNSENKDLVILSGGGGEGLEIYDMHQPSRRLWYQDEMEFVLKNDKPLIGICMGFEVVCAAYGQRIHETPILTQGFKAITPTRKGQKQISSKKLTQFESHYWQVHTAPKGFEVLAESETGIEIIKKDNIFATQFHPEKGGTISLQNLVSQLA
jgi:GMP synthase-like glutamine amidotransferase